MTALLQARIQANIAAMADQAANGGPPPPYLLEAATFDPYSGSFCMMAIITVGIIPGIFLFRAAWPNPGGNLGRLNLPPTNRAANYRGNGSFGRRSRGMLIRTVVPTPARLSIVRVPP